MRTIIAALVALGSSSASAAAGQCYWVGRQIYCDAGCRVVETWWETGTPWMRYWCGPPPEFLAAIGIVVLVVIAAVLAAISSAASSTGSVLTTAADEADARAREAEEIAKRLKAARAEADRFLRTYRDR